MNDSVSLALAVSALIIVIGFLSNYLFERTGLPDMLFLIILGYVVGPLLRLLDSSVSTLAPYLAALALVFILFDGGMKMNIRQVLSESQSNTACRVGLLVQFVSDCSFYEVSHRSSITLWNLVWKHLWRQQFHRSGFARPKD